MIDPARVAVRPRVDAFIVRASPLRSLVVLAIAIVAAVILAWVVLFLRPWDPHMPAAAAASALQSKVGGGPYTCHRQENDGSIVGMKDVDFFCESANVEDAGYFIGTSRHAITEIQPTG